MPERKEPMMELHAAPVLRLAVAQLALQPAALRENAETIAACARDAGADLLLTPELSLTGYDLGDAVHRLAQSVEPGSRLRLPALDAAPGLLVAGLPERAHGGPYNTAVVLQAGTVLFRHRKLYLPTYGMFDEGRWFGRGTDLRAWTTPAGWRIGVLVCEDFWHPALAYVLAVQQIELLLVLAAAPGRGAWHGSARNGGFASTDVWERIARATAQLYGIYIALANRVGVEGGVVFGGGSLIVGPDGAVLASADDDETTLTVELSRAELARARRPYAHARDDDPRLVLRVLGRALEATP